MSKRYDSKGRLILATDWAAIANLPEFIAKLADALEPGSGDWIVLWDGDTATFSFEPNSASGIPYVSPNSSWPAGNVQDAIDDLEDAFDGARTFAGYVGADGTTGNRLPVGWSAAKTATGKYLITHNLGLADATRLSPMIELNNYTNKLAHLNRVGTPNGNSFTLEITDVAETIDTDNDFFFIAQVN